MNPSVTAQDKQFLALPTVEVEVDATSQQNSSVIIDDSVVIETDTNPVDTSVVIEADSEEESDDKEKQDNELLQRLRDLETKNEVLTKSLEATIQLKDIAKSAEESADALRIQKEKELNEITQQNVELSYETATLKNRINELTKEKSALQTQTEENNKRLQSLEELVQAFTLEREKNEGVKAEIEQKQKELTEQLQARISTLEATIKESEELRQTLTETNKQLYEENKDLHESSARQREIDLSALNRSQAEVDDYHKRVKELSAEREPDQTAVQLKAELEQTLAENTNFKASLAQSIVNYRFIVDAKDKVEEASAAKDARIEELNKTLQESIKKIEELQQQLNNIAPAEPQGNNPNGPSAPVNANSTSSTWNKFSNFLSENKAKTTAGFGLALSATALYLGGGNPKEGIGTILSYSVDALKGIGSLLMYVPSKIAEGIGSLLGRS